MRIYRRKLIKITERFTGGFGGAAAIGAASDYSIVRAASYWLGWTVLWLVLSYIVYLILPSTPFQIILAVIWGAYFGITFLIFLGPKMIATIFGGIAGVSLGNLKAVVELISNALGAATELTAILNTFIGGGMVILNVSVLLFFVFVALPCLRAYGPDGQPSPNRTEAH